jgi:hypothetical protein
MREAITPPIILPPSASGGGYYLATIELRDVFEFTFPKGKSVRRDIGPRRDDIWNLMFDI